ncbi:phage tail sheath C-terminal domain-containing protein [Sphingosinicella sp. CPCC 101087]|uniref:phage tail sheath C-terminal domain-containing protein n=1 Tax=Sphingosinicella sp. CPCC 101087 TaxID=2497754 RepID=UPI00101E1824|nr:phage tail sheath C-terminal domain-containing protein [Sphingosinicella sp. CPCC 101087]
MPVSPTYPGVYIQELPSGVRPIIGVATSIGAIVGTFARGPADAAVAAFNLGDFERDFGGLAIDHEASYQVQQYFLNGGSQIWIVRVAPGAGAASAVFDHNDAGGQGESLEATAGRMIRGVSVDDPGPWGDNLRIDVDHDARDAAAEFNLTVSEVRLEDGREIVARTETFRNLTMVEGAPNNVIEVVNSGSRMIQLSRDNGWGLFRPAATGTVSAVIDITQFGTIADDNTIDVDFGAGAQPVVVNDVNLNPITTLADARGRLEAAIRAAQPGDPLWAGATVQTTQDGRLRVLAGRNAATYRPDIIVTFADNAGNLAERLALRAADDATENVQQYALGSAAALPAGFMRSAVAGTESDPLAAADLLGTTGSRTGVFALEEIDLFNILFIPDAALLGSVADLSQVMSGAINFAEQRRAFVLVDVEPNTGSLDGAQTWLGEVTTAGLRHRNAAAYFPRLAIPDPLNQGRPRLIGSSGTVAGIYARTDAARGVWKAPAGIETTLRGVIDIDYKLSDPEHGQLNPVGLNAVRTFDLPGNVLWGARTLVGADALASDWKYVPVRRTALFIEESLFRGLQWVVFEPNDAPLWAQIRAAAGSFMQGLFRQGAFQGKSPREAYLVKCDAETTTQADIDAGIVNVFVGFAPLKPAEFVIISLQLLAGQAQA